MNRLLIVFPDSLSTQDNVFREWGGVFSWTLERGRVHRVRSDTHAETPELAWFGVNPSQYPVADGPLTIAAFGKEPPPRSVHFHLSLASLDVSGTVRATPDRIAAAEFDELSKLLSKLDTRSLTVVVGSALDHGLVWESGSLDLGTTPIVQADGKEWSTVLPEGDGEPLLRRLIDDSVNLLSDLDVNKRRVDEGFAPLNLLWPWGQGIRPELPNLSLLRGKPTLVQSRNLRLLGLAALQQCRHSDAAFPTPLRLDASKLNSSGTTLVYAEHVARAVAAGRPDDAGRMLDEFGKSFLAPVVEASETVVQLIAMNGQGRGLSLLFDPRLTVQNIVPFDAEVVEDAKVPIVNDWESALTHLRP